MNRYKGLIGNGSAFDYWQTVVAENHDEACQAFQDYLGGIGCVKNVHFLEAIPLLEQIDIAKINLHRLRDVYDSTAVNDRGAISEKLITAENKLKQLQFKLSTQID